MPSLNQSALKSADLSAAELAHRHPQTVCVYCGLVTLVAFVVLLITFYEAFKAVGV